jgi:hypothetical protein
VSQEKETGKNSEAQAEKTLEGEPPQEEEIRI